jgi:type IV secretory pathway VirB4 component
MPRAGLTSATTYSASLILPPHSVPLTLPCRQVPIGDNLLNRLETVNYDPFALYPEFIRNRNLAFIGDVGNGKSASMKTFLERMLLLPERLGHDAETGHPITRRRRAVIIDRKGEYKRLAEQFDCQPAVLGHGKCINPFDARLSEQQQLAVLESFLRLLLDRVLTPFEVKCLEGAYNHARQRWTAALREPPPPGQTRREHFLLVDVRHALMQLPEDFVRDSLHSRLEVDHTASELAFALDQLLTGSQRGMFDGPTTDALDWRGQVVDIVVHPDYLTGNRHLIYQLMVVCVAVWLDQAWQAVDANERVDFFVCDEVWDHVKVRQFAEQLQECTKLGRSRGLCVLIAFHGPTDFRSAGDHGQAQVEMAERLLKDIDSFFLFRMSEDDALLLRGIVRLTDDDIETIQTMEPHQFLLVLGSGSSRRRFLVLHRITEAEREMVDTDRLDLA